MIACLKKEKGKEENKFFVAFFPTATAAIIGRDVCDLIEMFGT